MSLSSLLVLSGLSVAAKVAGRSPRDLVPEVELRQYMRGHELDEASPDFWQYTPPIGGIKITTDITTQGGSMARRTDQIMELEDRAKKLEALAALLRDPSLNDVVSELFSETDTHAAPKPLPNLASSPGAITESIRKIASELPQPFTASEVVRRLKERQFVFRRSALDTTRDALYRLSRGKQRVFRILEAAQGGKPNKYELI
jgi:hypothetical protein